MTPSALLRAALEGGDHAGLVAAYAEDAVVDAGLPGERVRVVGRDAIAGRLSGWYPGRGRMAEWAAGDHEGGAAVWLERVDEEGGACRQRHYLRVRDGRIVRHWIYAAPPRTAGPGLDQDALTPPGRLLSRVGTVAETRPIASSGWSGDALVAVRMADGRRLIAKRIVPGAGWIGAHTRDPGREALLARDGWLARLPPSLDPAIIDAERADGAWWVLMTDVSDALWPEGRRIPRGESARVLAAAAGMWAAFRGAEIPCLVTLARRLDVLGPRVAERERAGLDLLPNQLDAAWEAFAEAVPRDVADPVLAALEAPEALAAWLEGRGTTLIHGDLRDEHLGVAADGRVVLIDWGIATRGHPVADLCWYLCHCAWRIDATRDEIVDDYRRALGDDDDPESLEAGLLCGLVMYGWIFGHSAVVHPDPAERAWAREELDWWVPRARRALAVLPG
jgi:aminoglycoside phosphotransferase (APT) family kinase protein